MSGALAGLQYFQVPGAADRVETYAARKQARLVELIEAGEFHAYPDALRFVLAVRAADIRIAAASSSKNAHLFLSRIRLDTFAQQQGLAYDFVHPGLSLLAFFDADLSGRDFARGKPDPEIFVTSAAELGLPPRACFVVEDAVSGIHAARAGRMAALAVSRADDAALLAAAGADLVVPTLDEVDVGQLAARRLVRRTSEQPIGR
jgi:beta-phosphoglucomutase-like phosphatase (HAD superfamily)